MIKSVNIKQTGMEHLQELDKKAPDGIGKEIIAILAWNEMLVNWEVADDLLYAYSVIREVL